MASKVSLKLVLLSLVILTSNFNLNLILCTLLNGTVANYLKSYFTPDIPSWGFLANINCLPFGLVLSHLLATYGQQEKSFTT